MLASNCTLTEIASQAAGGQGLDDYDLTASPAIGPPPEQPAAKWSGREEAYLDQRTVRVQTETGSEFLKRWTIYLQHGRPPIQIAVDDLLTLTLTGNDGGTMTVTVPVISVDDRQQPDMPPDVQTVALVVEPTAR